MNGGQGLSKVDAEMSIAGASSTLTSKRYTNTSKATAAKVARIAGAVAKGNMGFTPRPHASHEWLPHATHSFWRSNGGGIRLVWSV